MLMIYLVKRKKRGRFIVPKLQAPARKEEAAPAAVEDIVLVYEHHQRIAPAPEHLDTFLEHSIYQDAGQLESFSPFSTVPFSKN